MANAQSLPEFTDTNIVPDRYVFEAGWWSENAAMRCSSPVSAGVRRISSSTPATNSTFDPAGCPFWSRRILAKNVPWLEAVARIFAVRSVPLSKQSPSIITLPAVIRGVLVLGSAAGSSTETGFRIVATFDRRNSSGPSPPSAEALLAVEA
jgi:hypothetical protein